MSAAAARSSGDLANDGVMPAQWRPQGKLRLPEQHLLAAVLENGLEAIDRYPTDSAVYRQAVDWFESDERDAFGSFAFDYVCDQLGLDAEYVRDGVRRLRRLRASGVRRVMKREVEGTRGDGTT